MLVFLKKAWFLIALNWKILGAVAGIVAAFSSGGIPGAVMAIISLGLARSHGKESAEQTATYAAPRNF